MKIPIFASLLLSIPLNLFANDQLNVNFDSLPAGALTLTQVKANWPGVTWDNGLSEGRVQVIGSPDSHEGNSIRVTYPTGSVGPTQGGAQWRCNFGGTADTLYSSYWLKPSLNFEFVKGGKLPGLCGSQCNTGGAKPTGSDGWSARLMWRTDGNVVLYLYYPDQPGTYAVDFPLTINGVQTALIPGQWTKLRTQVMLNTPGQNNGIVRCWFNDTLALEQTGLRLRDQDTMHINQFYFSTFHGGNDSTWAPTNDVSMDFDQFIVSSTDPMQNTSLLRSPSGVTDRTSPHLEGHMLWLPPSASPWNIRLYDSSGKTILNKKLPARSGFFPIPEPSAKYFLDASTGQQHFTIRP